MFSQRIRGRRPDRRDSSGSKGSRVAACLGYLLERCSNAVRTCEDDPVEFSKPGQCPIELGSILQCIDADGGELKWLGAQLRQPVS
jgi:hypothetical protein